jgi:sucrose-6-phosphate hydrolase SacC (GH32 family)
MTAPISRRNFLKITATAAGGAILAARPAAGTSGAAEDILIADFEGDTYGNWKVTGNCFGTGPCHGALPNQQSVSGFQGKGLVNTYLSGDGTTGTLTSPPIKIERKFINFLIGGGNKPDGACINLLVDGKVVRTATGKDDERLEWATWNVADLAGKSATIQIVDQVTDGWGHINIDQIVQSDTCKVEPLVPEKFYHERYRPQFHFSPMKNWTNDPNGLVFYKGEYHLFFQHNPTGINWGNMTWGHAVSPDLVHWTQLEHAIHPDKLGTIFSGSAVVDWNNTAGFQTGDEKVIVCIYTSAGNPFTQSIACSNDRGRTWTKYEKNPVLKHIMGGNRDPKVFWHAPTKKWVIALFLDAGKYALFGSPNLREWTKLSDVPPSGAEECPDMFELPVDGDAKNTRWVFWGGNSNYLIGRFDGTTFTKEAGPFRFEYGNNYYAAQSYSDVPKEDGRRIQIAWMQGGRYPGMPFNQQMSFPSALTLRTLPEGIRMCREPVKEIEKIHGKRHSFKDLSLKAGDDPLKDISGDLFDIRMEFEPGDAEEVTLNIRGTPVVYDVKKKLVVFLGKTAQLEPIEGKVKLQVLVDRPSIEVFGADGRFSMSSCFLPPSGDKKISLSAKGGTAQVKSLEVWELRSAWPE